MGEALSTDLDLETQQGFARSTAVMAVGTTISRVTGFLRLSAMAYALGIHAVRADAYNVANIRGGGYGQYDGRPDGY